MSIKMEDIDNLLKEKHKLPPISFPAVNNPIESESEGIITFKNKETFEGKMSKIKDKIILEEGVYTWPNEQKFYGNLFPNNMFNKKGKIIFPDMSELVGKFEFDQKNLIIKNAIYKTKTRIYQGSFRNNKFNGNFIIKDKEQSPNYLFTGKYINGLKEGKCTLETLYNGEKIKIVGNYKEGKKIGDLKIYIKRDGKEKLIFPKEKVDPEIKKEDLIENKNFKFVENNKKINCMKIINDRLLIGSYEYLIVYDINNNNNEITFNRKILIFKNENINDFIETKNKQYILLCSSKNKFKLIELVLEEKNDSCSNSTRSENLDFHLIQEFKGLENSKSILCIEKLSNEMVISGDCENIILWEYVNEKSFSGNPGFFGFWSNNSAIQFPEYKIKQHEKFYNVFSIVELESKNNEIIIGVAEPDSKSVYFIKIDNSQKMSKFKRIECHDEITRKKNIMKCFKNKLFVGCINKLIVIDVNKYEIIYTLFSESITYINSFLDNYIILGVTKKLNNFYEYEGYLLQKNILDNSEQVKIVNISSFTKYKHKGSIADMCINNNNKSIITAETDGKIIILE